MSEVYFFEHVLAIPQYEERKYKVMRGRDVHDKKLEQNKEYLRRRIGVTERYLDQYITNERMRGRVDEVVMLADGSMAPIDYKFAHYDERVYETYKTQLFCYALLIEDNFGREVNKGYLVYTRSSNKLIEVDISARDKQMVLGCTKEIEDILDNNRFPKSTKYKQRCVDCTYRNICVK
ncbi:CRISPR-associated protein Cas4 [Arcticibacter sp. MXS-1]|uniref:CRISPR-associated protein Cas4 n=1 Tax=Arcticibacter sp. MXS-1 TaxID=3341726 RepID=UPI0035A8E2F5